MALLPGLVDPGTFTILRLASGALMLVFLLGLRKDRSWRTPHWGAALALAGYAAPFSYAYVTIPVGVGAFVLFAAVQITMIGWDICFIPEHRCMSQTPVPNPLIFAPTHNR